MAKSLMLNRRYAPLEIHFPRPDLTPEEQVDYDLAKLERNYQITQRFIKSKSGLKNCIEHSKS